MAELRSHTTSCSFGCEHRVNANFFELAPAQIGISGHAQRATTTRRVSLGAGALGKLGSGASRGPTEPYSPTANRP